MKKKRCIALVLALLLALAATGCAGPGAAAPAPVPTAAPTQEPETVELSVSAAASLTEALTRIQAAYQKEEPYVNITMNFASSGALQTQIEEGAPADLFLSAAQKQMDALSEKGLIVEESRVNLLENKVVLIVPKDSTANITGFEDCLGDAVGMIAIGDPASVPVGQYAQEVFTYLNGWDTVLAKANLGTDVKQVLSWVESGDVDCGVVYSTDAAVSEGVRIIAEAPEGSHKTVSYPAALVKAGEHQEAAQDFLDYLKTDAARQIFTEYGFTVSE